MMLFKRKSATKARMRPPSPRRPGRGTLLILAVFLLGSASLRIAEHYAVAIASETDAEVATDTSERPVLNFDAIVAALDDREARLEQREIDLDTRAEAMALAERRIDKKLVELETAEKELRATIAMAETASEDDLSQLTSVYENMGAEEASALFSEMEPGFAAGFLGRMRPDHAAAILAGLDPNAAYEISVILAGRNADVPKE